MSYRGFLAEPGVQLRCFLDLRGRYVS
jgi:hypothetical protein